MTIEKAIGSLKIFLERKSPSTAVKHQLCLDVAEGLRHVHSRNIVHGDLKPDNVLIVESANPHVPFIAKLADFGAYIEICLPNSTSMTYSSYTGTRGWKPPEVYEDGTRWSEVVPQQLFSSVTVMSMVCWYSLSSYKMGSVLLYLIAQKTGKTIRR